MYATSRIELAWRAKERNKQSEVMMNKTNAQEEEAKEKLIKAQTGLIAAEEISSNLVW